MESLDFSFDGSKAGNVKGAVADVVANLTRQIVAAVLGSFGS